MRKRLPFFMVLIMVLSAVVIGAPKNVKAGGSLISYFTISGEDDRDSNSWALLAMKDKDFNPIIGREYDFMISPEENTIRDYEIITSSENVEISDIVDEELKDNLGAAKHRTVVFNGNIGDEVELTVKWSVDDKYGESLDNEFTFSFKIYDLKTRPVFLGDGIKLRAKDSSVIPDGAVFTAKYYTQYSSDEELEKFNGVKSFAIARFGDEMEFTYYELSLTDADGNPITEFSDYVTLETFGMYAEDKEKEYGYRVFYVDEDGNFTPCVTTYDKENNKVFFMTNHFSGYAIMRFDKAVVDAMEEVTTEVMTTTDEVSTASETAEETTTAEAVVKDTSSNKKIMGIVIAVVAVAAIGAGVTVVIKKKKD